MEPVGAEYAVILNDAHLRQGLIRDSEPRRWPLPKPERNLRIRHWLALALYGIASHVDPAVRAREPLYGGAPGSR
jgi:hypothetical protein